MSKMSGRRNLAAILSIVTIGAAFSVRRRNSRRRRRCHRGSDPPGAGAGQAAPDQRPVGGPADPDRSGGGRRRRTLRSDHPQPRHALALGRRARRNRHHRQGQAEYRSGNQLRLQFGRYQRKSLPSVQALGRALTNPDLKGSTFIVAGHTDAAGGDAYNQDLSERRADSIKRYLIDKFGIAGADLVTVGYGKTKLKDPANPMAEVNRRVQVVNMANKTTASK